MEERKVPSSNSTLNINSGDSSAKALGMYRVVSIPFTENFKVFMKFILAL